MSIPQAASDPKLLAATRAISFVEDGMALGLGTGTTATLFIRQLGLRVAGGLRVRCVASSQASHDLGLSLGIPMTTFSELPSLDLAIDGADEIGPSLALIKGGGGALLREKIVISAARQFLVIADSTKLVPHLGRFPLPVEVIQMALPLVHRKLSALAIHPTQRISPTGAPFLTDEGNFILDCACGPILDPAALAAQIRAIIGVVEHGLFLNMATHALVSSETGVRDLTP